MAAVSSTQTTDVQGRTVRGRLALPSDLEVARAALAEFFRSSRALQPRRLERSAYQAIAGGSRVDAFTNEKGLGTVLQRARERQVEPGGAAVGVSGSILDAAASLESELILSVDANPLLFDAMAGHVALLLAADLFARRNGGGARARVERFAALIEDLRQGGNALALPAMRELWPSGELKLLLATKDSLVRSLRMSEHFWKVKDFWFNGPEAERHVCHLTALARSGRIVAITASLDDAVAIDTVNRELARRHLSIAVFNLTNVPEYVMDNRALFRQLGALNLREDAKLLVSLHQMQSVKRRSPAGFIRPMEPETVALLRQMSEGEGSALLPANEWLGDGAAGHALHRAFWAEFPFRREVLSTVMPVGALLPDTFEAYEAAISASGGRGE